MATLATCPQCATQLALPALVAPESQGQCPKCLAEFPLDQAIQVSLPTIRIVEPVAEPVVSAPLAIEKPSFEMPKSETTKAPSETPDLGDDVLGDGVVEQDAPRPTLANWQNRLKNAIADDQPTTDDLLESTSTGASTMPESNFDYELSAPPTEKKEEATDNKPSLDTVPALSLTDPVAVEVEIETSPRQPTKRRLLSKLIAMVLFGPLLGGLVGLYGLLWIRGRDVDYLDLARYLPTALLPPSMVGEAADVSSESLASESSGEELQTTRTDENVRPASSETLAAGQSKLTKIASADFSPLVKAASDAVPDLVSGDLSTIASRGQMGQAYMTLCRLADGFALVSSPIDDPRVRTEITIAKNIYRQVTSDGSNRGDLAQIATRWWEYSERSSPGIFFVGRIESASPRGSQTLCQIVFDDPSAPRPIPVLFDRLESPIGAQIAVVGSIGDEPKGRATGSDSPRQKVVIAHFSYEVAP